MTVLINHSNESALGWRIATPEASVDGPGIISGLSRLFVVFVSSNLAARTVLVGNLCRYRAWPLGI